MSVKHIKSISIVLILLFICIVLLLYCKVAVIPLLKSHENEKILNALTQHLSLKSHELGQNELATAEKEIDERLLNVTRLCKKYHLGRFKYENNSNDFNIKEPPTPLFSYYFWNRDKKILWCPVYKAGSTSWLQNMMKLAGFPDKVIQHPPKQLSVWAREVYGESDNFKRHEIDKALKLLVVRHPFERLLSAYRDKLEDSTSGKEHGTHHYHLKYGKQIVKKFRKDFSIQKVEPTWEEFVRYIIKTDLVQYADDHWLSAYHSCTPCLVDYTIIAKTETYFRDQSYIIKKAGLQDLLKPRWSHSTIEESNRREVTKKYFGQLTQAQVKELYEKYKLDFLLFGYDYKEYLMYAKN